MKNPTDIDDDVCVICFLLCWESRQKLKSLSPLLRIQAEHHAVKSGRDMRQASKDTWQFTVRSAPVTWTHETCLSLN